MDNATRRSPMARIATITRKEVVDTFRDRRTILVTLMTAIVAGPLFLLLMLNLVSRHADEGRILTLPAADRENAPALIAFLERQQVKIVPAPADSEAKIRAGDL